MKISNIDMPWMECNDPQCADHLQGTMHHHIATPGEDLAYNTHGGILVSCAQPECKDLSAQIAAKIAAASKDEDEALNQIQLDLTTQAAEIAEWWVKTAQVDALKTVPKAVEYGAVDFDLMGQFMIALVGDKFKGADAAELAVVGREMAVTFYLIGKMGRMVGAFAQGMRPSDDTLYDTSVYAMMMRRIRETGTWVN